MSNSKDNVMTISELMKQVDKDLIERLVLGIDSVVQKEEEVTHAEAVIALVTCIYSGTTKVDEMQEISKLVRIITPSIIAATLSAAGGEAGRGTNDTLN